jgi:nitrile hydratase subunit beta
MSKSFTIGERVHVRAMFGPGHLRTPYYIRGKTGVIERVLDAFPNPELAAYGKDGPKQRLYRVRFAQKEVWPDYIGPAADTVDVELYEHWLEPA